MDLEVYLVVGLLRVFGIEHSCYLGRGLPSTNLKENMPPTSHTDREPPVFFLQHTLVRLHTVMHSLRSHDVAPPIRPKYV